MRAISSHNLDKSPMYDNSSDNHKGFGVMDSSGYEQTKAPAFTNNSTGMKILFYC